MGKDIYDTLLLIDNIYFVMKNSNLFYIRESFGNI